MLVVLVVLVVSGLIYAEIIMRPSNQGGYTPPAHRLEFADIDVSKTIGHMAIHLQKAYADANNVYIEATTDFVGNVDFAPHSSYWTTTLTTSSGATIPFLSGSAVFDGLSGASVNHQTVPSTYYFDGAGIQGSPSSRRLTLRLAPPRQFPVPAHPEYPRELTGAPLDFTFTVPFHTGKVVSVHQTVTAHGYALTLDHVVIAPSETRIYFKKDPVKDDYYAYATQLPVVRGQVYTSSPGTAVNGPAGATEYTRSPSMPRRAM